MDLESDALQTEPPPSPQIYIIVYPVSIARRVLVPGGDCSLVSGEWVKVSAVCGKGHCVLPLMFHVLGPNSPALHVIACMYIADLAHLRR